MTGVSKGAWELRTLAGVLAFLTLAITADGTRVMIEDGTWHRGPWRTNLAVYGSGHVVAVVLCWRAFRPPSLGWRRGIWGLAALVYGAWLSLLLYELFRGRVGGAGLVAPFFMISSGGQALLAIAGFVLEPADQALNEVT